MNAAFLKALKDGVEARDFVKIKASYKLSPAFKEKPKKTPLNTSIEFEEKWTPEMTLLKIKQAKPSKKRVELVHCNKKYREKVKSGAELQTQEDIVKLCSEITNEIKREKQDRKESSPFRSELIKQGKAQDAASEARIKQIN